jgi:diguanylate cyclase (GGDEF)-like protein
MRAANHAIHACNAQLGRWGAWLFPATDGVGAAQPRRTRILLWASLLGMAGAAAHLLIPGSGRPVGVSLACLIGNALCAGLAMRRRRVGLSERAVGVIVAWATLQLTVLSLSDGAAATRFLVLYLWVVAFAVFFLSSRRLLVAELAFVAINLGAALTHASGARERINTFVAIMGTGLAFAAVTAALRRSERRARLEQRARAAGDGALRRVATAVAADADAAALSRLVAEEIGETLDVDAVAVLRFEDDHARIFGSWAAPGLQPLIPDRRMPLASLGAARRVAEHGSTVQADLNEVALLAGYRRAGGAPIRAGGQVWGTVAVAARSVEAFPAELLEALERFAELVELGIASADARAQLVAQARSDPLTGLLNHRAFHDQLRVLDAGSDAWHLALIDLDDFKPINDLLGHQAGDDVLRGFARMLQQAATEGDHVARLGGDEFGWLMQGRSIEDARAGVKRLRESAAELLSGVARVRVSAGVCALAEASCPDRLVALADGALYWAKSHGRNQTVVYDPSVVVELSAEDRAARLEREITLASIRVLARAVDAKDSTTHEHSERVATLTALLAVELGWPAERVSLLREAGLVHDVGKIGVPDAILLKPSRLTPYEYERVKQHAALGADILSGVLSAEQVNWVRHHHERCDGRGYPDALPGAGTAEGAQILALADAWDVMTGPARSYSKARPVLEALEECRREAGAQFAPHVVEALARLLGEGEQRHPLAAAA